MSMPFGPLDDPVAFDRSEFGGDDDIGWAGDLGLSRGRELTNIEKASLTRSAADNDGIDPRTGLPAPEL